ncbi:MAG: hypothetical protein DYH20_03565 [Gammaproteobacteria bacterium PRO9]|nr:hypothetical protein [Gammaproteobacteria bacterium PRO9]
MQPRAISIAAGFFAGIGMLLPMMVAAQDSGDGIDLQFGNRLFPDAGAASWGCDERGMSWLTGDSRRNPTGFLYQCPPERPPMTAAGDWLYSATLPIGMLFDSGDEDNAQWLRYVGWDDGLMLGPMTATLVRPEDGSYLDFRGSRLDADNQFYKVTGGRAGEYRIEAFIRDQPNVVSANAKSIWNGIGTNHLTLAGGLVPGASTPAQVAAVSAAAPERRLEVQRDKLGLGATWHFNREWTGYFSGTYEERSGSRPFGGPFFFNYPFPDNGGILETPRLVDDGTTNVNGGVRFAGDAWRMELAYNGSFYRSKHVSFDYEMPFALTPVVPGAVAPSLTLGEFASEPDNDYHNLRLNLTRRIPLNGELSVTAATGQMKQNDSLLPPMSCQGQFGIDLSPTGAPANPFLYDCDDWNTTASLSRTSANLKIDTTMLSARIVLQPTSEVTWRGDIRFDRQDYRGNYLAFNPLTGQYGYIAENGAQGSVVPGEMGVWDPVTAPSIITRVRNLPLDKKTIEANAGADWRISRYDTIGATYTFIRTDRDNRERTEVDDQSIRLTWASRRLEAVTFRTNYTYLHRSGNTYNHDPYEFTFSTSLPGFVPPAGGVPAHTVDALRKYDVASRDQYKIDLMATMAIGEDMTISASVRAEANDYGADLGRQDYDTFGSTLQWEWQPSPATVASAWYGYDRSNLKLANVNDAAMTPDPALGGATYPLDNLWWARDQQRNHYFGATLDQQLGKVKLELAASYTGSRGTTDFSFASPAALAWAGPESFPAMIHRVTSFSVGLLVPINDRLSLRVIDLYEHGSLADWHYQGFGDQHSYDHRVYTDGGPEDYSDNLIAVMLQVRL